MENNDMPLSELSTKEEVANYFHNSLHLNDEVKKIVLTEYISGDILTELTAQDLNELNMAQDKEYWHLFTNMQAN